MGFTTPAIIWYADELISRANTTTAVPAWQIGAPRHGRIVRAFARTVRPLHGSSGFLCQIVWGYTKTTMWHPDSSEHNRTVRTYHWIVRHSAGAYDRLGRTVRIHIRITYYCTLCTKLLHTTAAVRSAPYIFKPQLSCGAAPMRAKSERPQGALAAARARKAWQRKARARKA